MPVLQASASVTSPHILALLAMAATCSHASTSAVVKVCATMALVLAMKALVVLTAQTPGVQNNAPATVAASQTASAFAILAMVVLVATARAARMSALVTANVVSMVHAFANKVSLVPIAPSRDAPIHAAMLVLASMEIVFAKRVSVESTARRKVALTTAVAMALATLPRKMEPPSSANVLKVSLVMTVVPLRALTTALATVRAKRELACAALGSPAPTVPSLRASTTAPSAVSV